MRLGVKLHLLIFEPPVHNIVMLMIKIRRTSYLRPSLYICISSHGNVIPKCGGVGIITVDSRLCMVRYYTISDITRSCVVPEKKKSTKVDSFSEKSQTNLAQNTHKITRLTLPTRETSGETSSKITLSSFLPL